MSLNRRYPSFGLTGSEALWERDPLLDKLNPTQAEVKLLVVESQTFFFLRIQEFFYWLK